MGIVVAAPEWGVRELGVVGLGDSAAFGVDAWPGQSEFWAGQGHFWPRQAGQGYCGPGQAGLGSGQVEFGGGWLGGGVISERGSNYDQNATGQGISA